MRHFRFWPQMALVLALAVMNGGCVLVPELKERIVELALTGTTTKVFTVDEPDLEAFDTVDDIDLGSIDLAGILEDAGVDVSKVTSVKISAVEYRITLADADPTRALSNGQVTVQRGSGSTNDLVAAFSANLGTTSSTFTNIPLVSSGVGTVNQLLEDMRVALPGTVSDRFLAVHVKGDLNGTPTRFDVEIKLKVTITGNVEVEVPA